MKQRNCHILKISFQNVLERTKNSRSFLNLRSENALLGALAHCSLLCTYWGARIRRISGFGGCFHSDIDMPVMPLREPC